MDVHEDGQLRLVKMPAGPYGNNVYLIQDRESGETIVVDAPPEGEKVLEALGEGRVTGIVMTHRHPDHWMSIDGMKSVPSISASLRVPGLILPGHRTAMGIRSVPS